MRSEPSAPCYGVAKEVVRFPLPPSAKSSGTELKFVGFIASVDGKTSVTGSISGPAEECEKLGIKLAEQLLADGGHAILAEVYQREVSREKEIPV